MSSVRSVYVGRETTEGTAATTLKNMQVNACRIANRQAREVPQETTGTRITTFVTRRQGRHAEVTVRTFVRFDQLGWWLVGFLGAPTTTAVAGASGAFDHVFKGGGTSLPSLTVAVDYGLTSGNKWRRATGCKVNTMRFAFGANQLVVVDMTLFGRWASMIATPTPVPIVDPGWIHPIEAPQSAVTVNAVDYYDLMEGTVDLTNNLQVRHAMGNSADARRMSLGDFGGTFSLTALVTAYAGSFVEEQEGDGLLDQIIVKYTDTDSEIGTGTPVNPEFELKMPKPYTMDGDLEPTDTDTDQTVSGELGYDTALASNISVRLRNTESGYPAS